MVGQNKLINPLINLFLFLFLLCLLLGKKFFFFLLSKGVIGINLHRSIHPIIKQNVIIQSRRSSGKQI